MTIVDASVAVKWLLPETGDASAARVIKERQPLFAPAIINLEVTAAILRRYREKELSEASGRRLCDHWGGILEQGLVELIPIADLFDLARDFAFQLRHPLADCFYLAAGKTLGMPVITADRRLHEKGKTIKVQSALLAGFERH